jgi:C-methyltransferase
MKQELKKIFTEHWTYLALNAACELELFDKIEAGENNLNKLISINKWDKDSLFNLIGFCINDGYINQLKNGYLSNTKKGNLLRKENTDGLYYACLLWADEHMNAWQNLAYTIQTGKSSFEKKYGEPFFDYLNKQPQQLENYQKAIHEYARDDYQNISKIHDFSHYHSIIDVGGSHGTLIQQIKKDNPHINCSLFDLPQVINALNINNIQLISGNFFNEIPKKNDAIILSRVLHDWDDKKAIIILKNCYIALPKNGQLFIIEILSDKLEQQPHLLNLNMKIICNSRERTTVDFKNLLIKTGFTLTEIKPLNHLQFIIIAQK